MAKAQQRIARATAPKEEPSQGGSVILMESEEQFYTGYGADPSNRSKTYYDQAKVGSTLSKDEYRAALQLCRDMAKDEGLIASFLDMHLGLNSQGMENKFSRSVPVRYKVAFNGFASQVNGGFINKERGLDCFQRQFCYEYWVSGLVCTVETVASVNMGVAGRKNVTYKVPSELDILDPLRLDLDKLHSNGEVSYDLNPDDVIDIKKNGVKAAYLAIYDDKPKVVKPSASNPNPYQVLGKADIVKLVVGGASTVPLPMNKVRLYRRSYDSYSTYPVPYLSRCLTALSDKALLRESDRSVLSKIINMMLLYRIGQWNNQGHKTNVGDKQITAVMGTFLQNLRRSKDGRVMVHFVPDTHDPVWISPDSSELLDEKKYMTVNQEVLSTLFGCSAWLVIKTGTVDTDFLMRVFQSQQDHFFSVFKRFVEAIYDDIITWNNMNFQRSSVNLKQKIFNIFNTDQFTVLRQNLADRGQISVRTLLEDAGEDFDTEYDNLIEERDIRAQDGILTSVPTFTQTVVDNTTKPPVDKTTPPVVDNTTPPPDPNAPEKQVSSNPSPGRPPGPAKK